MQFVASEVHKHLVTGLVFDVQSLGAAFAVFPQIEVESSAAVAVGVLLEVRQIQCFEGQVLPPVVMTYSICYSHSHSGGSGTLDLFEARKNI